MNSLTPPLLLVESLPGECNLLYGSGFSAIDPVVFLDAKPKIFLVVPLLEVGRASASCPGVQVMTPDELNLEPGHRRRLSEWALGLLRLTGTHHVRVPAMFPVSIADRLREEGITVTLLDGPPYPERAIKTPEELTHLRVAQRAAVNAMKTAIDVLRRTTIRRDGVLIWKKKPLTSEALRLMIDESLLASSSFARETIVAGGRHAADPHDRGSGPLRAHETIVLDIFPQHKISGYWGDITRTVVRGKANPQQKAFHRAVARAQNLALSMIRPGITGKAVHEAVQQSFNAAGFPTRVDGPVVRGFFHGTGHGIGLDVHEAPSLSPAGGKLVPGHVVTVEPGLYDPDIGGVRIEDVVVVTETGCKVLATCPKPFELL